MTSFSVSSMAMLRIWLRVALTTCLLACPVAASAAEPRKVDASAPPAVEVHFTDGSVLKMTLLDNTVDITTAAGKKTLRVSDLRKIEVAHRLSEADSKIVAAAIKDLGSAAFKDRERASAELLGLGLKAYPALVAAVKGDDAETRKRSEMIIEKLKETFPEEMFELRKDDVLFTKEGKTIGKLGQESLKATTTQFGPVSVKLIDVVRVRWVGFPDPDAEKLAVQPDPGTLVGHQAQVGKVFAFKVTGAAQGSVWGTGTYTSDSLLACAAVHAGVLKVGQTGTVKVRIAAGLGAYQGSTQNGVTTRPYGAWDGSYEILKK